MESWWRGAVIYQIYPRSFQDSDGDGVGDLPGILRRLDHVADLGADAVWLSPIFPSPMLDMGYDVSDYTDIDPLFGSLADFDALLARAHQLGLKVIIDQVLSHTSDRHPWFIESRSSRVNPKADWYVWADPKRDGSLPNNWLAVFGGPAWDWDPTRRQYYLHNFLAAQPDLNLHNRAVQDALLGVLRFWLERGVDGFRLDTVNFYFHDADLRPNPPLRRQDAMPPVNPYEMQDHTRSRDQPDNIAFLKRMRALLDSYGPDHVLLGEVGGAKHRALKVMADYTKGDDRLHMAYSFDMLGPEFDAGHFRSRLETYVRAAPDGWPCWAFSNHDVIRHATRWAEHGSDRDALARQTGALLLSLRGSVCLYQGEELGLTEAELAFEELTDPPGIRFWPDYKGRDGCRTPMPWDDAEAEAGFTSGKPWLPIKAPQRADHVAGQVDDPDSILSFYRDMIAFRRAEPALVRGPLRAFRADEPVLAFERTPPAGGGAPVAAVFNLSPASVDVECRHFEAIEHAPAQAAELGKSSLSLGPNGFAFLRPTKGAVRSRIRYRNGRSSGSAGQPAAAS